MTAYVFDVDGTLFDTAHRQQYLASKPKNWKMWIEKSVDDPIFKDMADMLRLFALIGYHRVVLATGRSEDEREVLEYKLEQNNLDLYIEKIYMRKSGDYRPDDVVKSEFLPEMIANDHEPHMIFEDRTRVVNMWRSLGYRCLQVTHGDF